VTIKYNPRSAYRYGLHDDPITANDKPCAWGGMECGKLPNDAAHECLIAYGCDGDHEPDPNCHTYVCPRHGGNGITDSTPDSAGGQGYWYCAPCRLRALLDAMPKAS